MRFEHYVKDSLLNMRLGDMRCKHALSNSSKACKVIELSRSIGYNSAEWGWHSKHVDIHYHADVIMRMEEDHYNHPERIVICKYDFCDKSCIWLDNIHTAVKYIRQYGKDAKLKDIPFYIIDLSGTEPIVSENGKGIVNDTYVNGAISCSMDRYNWSNLKELIELHYTLDEFLVDNSILLTCKEYFGTIGATRGRKAVDEHPI